MTLLSFVAILLLPRQFHVTVVENNSEAEIRRASWLFPLYLVLINLFVLPIAMAGLLTFPAGKVDSDMFVLALPLVAKSDTFTLLAFIGGLSAATAMVIVETVALAIMVSNDIVMPWVLQRREAMLTSRADVGGLLLKVRRTAIVVILLLAYLYYRSAAEAQLAAIGLLAFAAVAQLAPAFFGGLLWRRATAPGAIAGMTVGILAWGYTLLLPTVADIGIIGRHILTDGPWGLLMLRPQALLGLDMHPLVHGVIWSLSLNVLAYIGFSLRRQPTSIERMQADVFVPSHLAPTPSFRLWRSSVTVEELTTAVARYLGQERTRSSFESFAAARRISLNPQHEADFQLMRYAEHLLASAIGAASSRLVLSLLLRKRTVSTKAALKLLDDASAAIHYNREILQQALDHVRQGIAVFDKDLRLVCWNRQFGDILDLPADLTRVGVGLDEILRSNAQQGALGPGPIRGTRCTTASHATRKAANPCWSVSPTAAWWSRCAPTGCPRAALVTTITDITPSVVAAEQLERANTTLEGRVRDRTAELTRLNAELARAKADAEEANISKTRFLAAASHDILQPLNAARLYVTSLIERQGSGEDGRLIDNVDASLEAVEEIFGALLEISRLDAGAMRPEPVSLPDRRTAASARGRIHAAGAREGPQAHLRALLAERALGPPPAAAFAAELRLERRQIHTEGPRADRLPAPAQQAAHRGLRHRPRHPAIQEARDFPRVPPARRRRQGGARARPRPLHRRAHRARAQPQDRGALGGRPRLALLGRSADCPRAAPASQPQQRAISVDRSQLVGTTVLCIDNEPKILDGMETLLGGWGCRVLKAPDLAVATAAISESKTSPERPADRLPPRQGQRHRSHRRVAPPLRRRPAGDPDHRRPLATRSRRSAGARRSGAQQADQAGGAARADGTMAGAARRRGGVAGACCAPSAAHLDLSAQQPGDSSWPRQGAPRTAAPRARSSTRSATRRESSRTSSPTSARTAPTSSASAKTEAPRKKK